MSDPDQRDFLVAYQKAPFFMNNLYKTNIDLQFSRQDNLLACIQEAYQYFLATYRYKEDLRFVLSSLREKISNIIGNEIRYGHGYVSYHIFMEKYFILILFDFFLRKQNLNFCQDLRMRIKSKNCYLFSKFDNFPRNTA